MDELQAEYDREVREAEEAAAEAERERREAEEARANADEKILQVLKIDRSCRG